MTRALLVLVAVLMLAAPLSACGKKGNLEPPPGSQYDKVYPTR
jgi:predicted small lipoprotein YifL